MATVKRKLNCTSCKKLLGEVEHLNDGKINIKCGKCGVMNTIEAVPKPKPEGLNLGTFSIQHISTNIAR